MTVDQEIRARALEIAKDLLVGVMSQPNTITITLDQALDRLESTAVKLAGFISSGRSD